MPSVTTAPSVLVRAARGSDGPALARLAALDSAAVPPGELLVAETDGALIAARALGSGTVIADPFRPSADVVALLTLRGRSVEPRRMRRGLAERMGLRAGRVVSHTA
ncbi:MAG: hypothetical protein QOK21_2896 [Solirubrobacteraceae bacterium]|jgi:hypothetical protein|nr:hypothetical protein [Solirubrobacteraceae bacterium]